MSDEQIPEKKKGFTFFDTKEEANEKLSCTLMGCVLGPVAILGFFAFFIILRVVFGLFQIAWYNY